MVTDSAQYLLHLQRRICKSLKNCQLLTFSTLSLSFGQLGLRLAFEIPAISAVFLGKKLLANFSLQVAVRLNFFIAFSGLRTALPGHAQHPHNWPQI